VYTSLVVAQKACEANKWCYAVAEPLGEVSLKSGKYVPGSFYLMRNTPGCDSCFESGSKFTMHAQSAISPEMDGKWREVRVSGNGKCTEEVKEHTCVVKPIGFWKSLRQIATKETYTEFYGTSRAQTDMSTRDYASEVIMGVAVSGGWDNGDGPGLHGSVEVSAEFKQEWSESYSTEIATEATQERTFEIQIDDDRQRGKYLWQFAQKNTGSCGESTSLFRKYVFTAGLSQKPCCYPGHCTDAHLFSCDWCAKGYLVPNADARCQEGLPPCPQQIYQLQNVNSFLVFGELGEGEIRPQPCPSGYSGVVAAQCTNTELIVTESCRPLASTKNLKR